MSEKRCGGTTKCATCGGSGRYYPDMFDGGAEEPCPSCSPPAAPGYTRQRPETCGASGLRVEDCGCPDCSPPADAGEGGLLRAAVEARDVLWKTCHAPVLGGPCGACEACRVLGALDDEIGRARDALRQRGGEARWVDGAGTWDLAEDEHEIAEVRRGGRRWVLIAKVARPPLPDEPAGGE